MAPAMSGGATAHPTRQPVTLNVFEMLLIVTVRSAMPSIDAIGHVHGVVEHDVLVDLVGDDDDVPLARKRAQSAPAPAA